MSRGVNNNSNIVIKKENKPGRRAKNRKNSTDKYALSEVLEKNQPKKKS